MISIHSPVVYSEFLKKNLIKILIPEPNLTPITQIKNAILIPTVVFHGITCCDAQPAQSEAKCSSFCPLFSNCNASDCHQFYTNAGLKRQKDITSFLVYNFSNVTS
jgi:hypothetical protein